MRPFVIDTNVVVAGLITRASDSPVRRLLDGLLAGTIPFVLSQDLLAEYRRVLLRPAIRTRHGLTTAQVDVVLAGIVMNARIRDPSGGQGPGAPDRGDDHLWQLLYAVKRHPELTPRRHRKLTPEETAYVAELERCDAPSMAQPIIDGVLVIWFAIAKTTMPVGSVGAVCGVQVVW